MTRKLAVSKTQMRHAAEIAKEFGVSVKVETDGSVTVSPRSASDSEEDELDAELEELEQGLNPWPGPNLNHREEKVLQYLVDAKGQPLPASGIAFAGPVTVKSLLAHGLIAIEGEANSFDRSMDISATRQGLAFFKRRADHRKKYPYF